MAKEPPERRDGGVSPAPPLVPLRDALQGGPSAAAAAVTPPPGTSGQAGTAPYGW